MEVLEEIHGKDVFHPKARYYTCEPCSVLVCSLVFSLRRYSSWSVQKRTSENVKLPRKEEEEKESEQLLPSRSCYFSSNA